MQPTQLQLVVTVHHPRRALHVALKVADSTRVEEVIRLCVAELEKYPQLAGVGNLLRDVELYHEGRVLLKLLALKEALPAGLSGPLALEIRSNTFPPSAVPPNLQEPDPGLPMELQLPPLTHPVMITEGVSSPPPAPAAPPAKRAEDSGFELEIPSIEESGSEVVALEDADESDSFDLDEAPAAAGEDFEYDASFAPPPLAGSRAAARDDEDMEDDEAEYEEAPAPKRRSAPVAASAPAATTAKKSDRPARTGSRRATVRYYYRMNPQRIYPLLVMLTKDVVAQVKKKGAAQKATGPLQVDLDSPVEIEPILPGCICHPPRMAVRLTGDNHVATFHVVPQILGEVTGAKVAIRQNDHKLAEIDLDVKVVQKTMVLLSGGLTLVMPFLLSIAKHYRLDFETQQAEGFSLYFAAAQVMVRYTSPIVLTVLLGGVTGLLYWLTRPRTRDAFWDFRTLDLDGLLRKIEEEMKSDPRKAAKDLLDLIEAHPEYQPALLACAAWHSRNKNYAAALETYEKAFALGVADDPNHYHRAALAASRVKQDRKALAILQDAEAKLPAGTMTGPMYYNMGCYHARLGDVNASLASLRKAVRAGYRKPESYLEDPDLDLVRSQKKAEFMKLIDEISAG